MTGLRIRMISSVSRFGGGLGVYTQSLAQALRNFGDDVVIQSDRNGRGSTATEPNVEQVWSRDIRFPLQNLVAARRGPPSDLVHVQHEPTLYGGPETMAAFPFMLALLRKLNHPIVTTLHAVVPISELRRLRAAGYTSGPIATVRVGLETVVRLSARWSQALVVHHESLRQTLLNEFRVPPERVHVIPMGVVADMIVTPRAQARAQLGLDEGRVVLTFGYLARYKGLETLMDAFNQIAPHRGDLTLVVCGGAPARERSQAGDYVAGLRRRLLPTLRERVRFPGFVPESQVGAYFSSADLVVFPYVNPISSSLVFAVAQGYGRATVVSRIGPFVGGVSDPEAYFEPGSAADLARVMVNYLDHPDRLSALGESSRTAGEKSTWPIVAQMHRELYEELLDRRGRGTSVL